MSKIKTILITGAAGYIGSHVVKQLLNTTNYHLILIDNLSTGFINTINTLKDLDKSNRICFYKVDLNDTHNMEKIFKDNSIDEIIHFAAFSQVSESIEKPLLYYVNNTYNSMNLISLSIKYNVKKFIFSSSAAVYGEPNSNLIPIKEDIPLSPINPYGFSKYFTEQILIDAANTNKTFKYVILRYFNVAGADINNEIGENHQPETHLIPLLVKTALTKDSSFSIYGDDYDTFDGTCIRDYIHVCDLADIHIKALDYLETNNSNIFNCGYGKGYSVKEIISEIKELSKNDFKVVIQKRRKGDPSILIANCDKLKQKMKWIPRYNDIKLICKTAYEWEKSNK